MRGSEGSEGRVLCYCLLLCLIQSSIGLDATKQERKESTLTALTFHIEEYAKSDSKGATAICPFINQPGIE